MKREYHAITSQHLKTKKNLLQPPTLENHKTLKQKKIFSLITNFFTSFVLILKFAFFTTNFIFYFFIKHEVYCVHTRYVYAECNIKENKKQCITKKKSERNKKEVDDHNKLLAISQILLL